MVLHSFALLNSTVTALSFSWDYFSHDHSRSRAYRWGEDGLLGITDRECRLCFGLALWNEKDPILKERLFGLTGNEGKTKGAFLWDEKSWLSCFYFILIYYSAPNNRMKEMNGSYRSFGNCYLEYFIIRTP